MKKYSFIVDLSKNGDSNKIYNQILFCTCGNKQKTKITVKRTILKNSETFYEDKYSLEEIICSNCKVTYNVGNNVYGIKSEQKVLVEVEFQKQEIKLKNNHFFILVKNKKYYCFDSKEENLSNFVLQDYIFLDKKEGKIKYYCDESMLDINLFNFQDQGKIKSNFLEKDIRKNKLQIFNLSKNNIMSDFFEFHESVNYNNLETCYSFFNQILKNTYDYDDLNQERFFDNFKISNKIFEDKENPNNSKFIQIKDPFGSNKFIKKRLNTGDYLNRLVKMSNITSIFITYPSISTLYKTKGLDFLFNGFNKDFFCDYSTLKYYNATNTNKILEICAKIYNTSNISFYKKSNSEGQNITNDFKLSPLLIKNFRDTDDVNMFYQFFGKKLLNKKEIENLFLKYEGSDVIKVICKIVSNSNLRSVRLEMKHINHILKNRLFAGNDDEWLNIYYDTINTLNLICDLLKAKNEKSKKLRKYDDITKISENKLFDTKNFIKLKELHDEMFAIYRAMEDESKDMIFREVVKKYKDLNTVFNLFEFRVIPNLKELSQEGLVMKHCIYTYLNDIVSGNYLAIRIKDKVSREKATMGIKIENNKLYLQQLKGYENSRPTFFLIRNALNFCEDFNINAQSVYLHKSDIQSNESLEKRMKNYLSKEEAKEKRKKLLK